MVKLPSAPSRSQVVGIIVGLAAFLGAFPILFFNEQRIDPQFFETVMTTVTFEQLHTEYLIITWTLRAFGFVLLWIGMVFLWLPLARMLKILPSLELAKTSSLVFITLPSALALATIVILLSMVVESLLVTLLIGVLAPSLLLAVLRYNRPKDAGLPFA